MQDTGPWAWSLTPDSDLVHQEPDVRAQNTNLCAQNAKKKKSVFVATK